MPRPTAEVPPATFQALHEVAVATGGVLEPRGLGRLVGQHARQLLSADSSSLWLFDAATQALHPFHLEGPSVPPSSVELSPGSGLIGRTFKERKPFVVTDYPSWKQSLSWAHRYSRPGAAAVAVPLLVGGRAVGVLAVGFPNPPVRESTVVEVLTLLAAQVAPAVEAARLEASEQLFRSMFEQHPDAVFAFDSNGHVTLANPGCAHLSGYSVEEILGEPRTYTVVDEYQRGLERFQAALAGEPQRFESLLVRKDGQRVHVSVTQIPIVIDGRVTGVFGIARDITARVQAEQERGELLKDLADAQRHAQEVLTRVLSPEDYDVRMRRRTELQERLARLTPRELDVLRQLALGKTNPEIGHALGLSAKAARNRVANVLAKLGVPDRTQAAVIATELGVAASR